jgi:hypothetical protein
MEVVASHYTRRENGLIRRLTIFPAPDAAAPLGRHEKSHAEQGK